MGASPALLSSGDLASDTFLDEIAQRAVALTGAVGAAVAISEHHVVYCRARCGESSPPLGAILDVNSGVSGECLRTGRALQCSDTETDPRVDRDVCRLLGVRSLAVVPIRKGTTTVGILEAVSAKTQAFENAQLEVLAELAGLVASAVTGTTDPQSATQWVVVPPSPPRVPKVETSIPAVESTSTVQDEIDKNKRRGSNLKKRLLGTVALAGFLIANLVIAMSLLPREDDRKTSSPPTGTVGPSGTTAPSQSPEQKQNVRARNESVSTNPAIAASSLAIGAVTRDHGSELSEGESRRSPKQRQTSQAETPLIILGGVGHSYKLPGDLSPDSPPDPLSQLGTEGLGEQAEAIGKVLSSPNLRPPAVPVFQSISGGTLDRNVRPIYPAEALTLRLEGSVVLSVVIDETGNVRTWKALNGDPILARAAIDAVRQWHYHPYLLNGHPIKREAKITLTFKLP